MELNDFLDKEETILVKAEEGQLVLAQEIKNAIIMIEHQKKELDKQEKKIKKNIEDIMREYQITKYESNDKTLMITLGEDGITETIDKDKLFLKYPDVYRDEEIVKETPRKGSLRITIRNEKY